MHCTEKIDILDKKDKFPHYRLDARDTEAPLRGFKFVHTMKQTLVKGDTIELGRIDRGSVIQFIMGNNFEGVKYSVGTSNGSSEILSKPTVKKELVSSIPPMPPTNLSVYLTVIDGEIKIGDSINGVIVYC